MAMPAETALASPEVVSNSGVYVALGDSVASGQGLPSNNTPGTNEKTCGISWQAYPALVAAKIGKPLVNAACSGASMDDLFTEQHLDGTSRDIEPQLDTAFADGTPRLITITAGANDMRWMDYVSKCYNEKCGTKFDDAKTKLRRGTVIAKLDVALNKIERLSDKQPPQTLVTGYYNPVSDACSKLNTNITSSEIKWLQDQHSKLNAALERTVKLHDFADFVPISFAGHDLCSADPWVSGITNKAPLHPNARGQQEIARVVLAAAK